MRLWSVNFWFILLEFLNQINKNHQNKLKVWTLKSETIKGGDRPGKRVPFNRAKLLNIGNGLLSGINLVWNLWTVQSTTDGHGHNAERQYLRKSIQQRCFLDFFLRNKVPRTELRNFRTVDWHQGLNRSIPKCLPTVQWTMLRSVWKILYVFIVWGSWAILSTVPIHCNSQHSDTSCKWC